MKFTFTRWQQPRESSLREVGKNGFTVFFGVGITNPLGPTLSIVGADGTFEKEGTVLPVTYVMLNPFSQECKIVGEVTAGEKWTPLEDLPPFFSLLDGASCPNLLLPLTNLREEAVIDLYAKVLMRFQDAGEMLAKIRKHPGQPVKRVQQDVNRLGSIQKVRHLFSGLGAFRKRFGVNEANELAATQLKPENVKAEFHAFFFAWNGSIEFTQESGLAQSALSFRDFAKILSQLTLSSGILEKVFGNDFSMTSINSAIDRKLRDS